MTLYQDCIGAIRDLRDGNTESMMNTPMPVPSSDAFRVERFAIQAHLLSMVAPEIFDILSDGRAAFVTAPGADVTTPVRLAAWTSEQFKQAVASHCEAGNADVQVLVDRLSTLNEPMYDASFQLAGIKPQDAHKVAPDKIERALSSMQTENFSLELDKNMRILGLIARIYGLEFPQGDRARALMVDSYESVFTLARQSIQVQDFFDALGVFALLNDRNEGKEVATLQFAAAAEVTNLYWHRLHGMHAKNNSRISGEKPKAFYKVKADGNVIAAADPIVEKVAKKLTAETVNERIGCAAMLQKATDLPRSILHLGLEATTRALDDMGYFERTTEEYVGYDPELLDVFELDGKTYFLGQSALSCIAVATGPLG